MPRVLVIEDDSSIRTIIRKTLEHAGYQVLEASDGLQGMGVFKFGKIDLVITDLLMPNQEGVSTIHQLREVSPDLPIIAISGSYDIDTPLDDAMIGGANMRIAKPFALDDLVAAVHVLLGRDEG